MFPCDLACFTVCLILIEGHQPPEGVVLQCWLLMPQRLLTVSPAPLPLKRSSSTQFEWQTSASTALSEEGSPAEGRSKSVAGTQQHRCWDYIYRRYLNHTCRREHGMLMTHPAAMAACASKSLTNHEQLPANSAATTTTAQQHRTQCRHCPYLTGIALITQQCWQIIINFLWVTSICHFTCGNAYTPQVTWAAKDLTPLDKHEKYQ